MVLTTRRVSLHNLYTGFCFSFSVVFVIGAPPRPRRARAACYLSAEPDAPILAGSPEVLTDDRLTRILRHEQTTSCFVRGLDYACVFPRDVKRRMLYL